MKKQHILNFSFIVIFVLASGILHLKDFNKLPASTHAWAQSDHYAIALGFYNDGFDIFHPTTFALDVQFPAKEKLEKPNGITAVDLPIVHYIVALLMKALGTTAPWVFRMTMLFLSFLGLFSVFRAFCTVKNSAMAIFFVSFIMFQPIYCFYQDGFHVSMAAFNVFLLALSFGIRYMHSNKQKHFIFLVLLLTLAALMRFTHIISLLALGGSFVIISFNRRKLNENIYYIAIGVALVLAYFIYNKILAAEFGSVFLGKPMPPHSIKEAAFFLKRILSTYARGFLPLVHLTSLVMLIVAYKKSKISKGSLVEDSWFLWGFVSLIGTTLFSLLMMWGISAHDYYSLDTWLPFISIALSYMLYHIDYKKISKETLIVAVSLFVVASFSIALEVQLKKYRDDVPLNNTDLIINDFKESSIWLNEIVPAEAQVVLICSGGWNTPMMGWQRKVYRIHNINETTLGRLANEHYDYVVVCRSGISEFYRSRVQSSCQLIDSNGVIDIYQQKGLSQ